MSEEPVEVAIEQELLSLGVPVVTSHSSWTPITTVHHSVSLGRRIRQVELGVLQGPTPPKGCEWRKRHRLIWDWSVSARPGRRRPRQHLQAHETFSRCNVYGAVRELHYEWNVMINRTSRTLL